MPRASRVPAKLVTRKTNQLASNAPQLWNAKERIRTNVGLTGKDINLLQKSTHSEFLRQLKNTKKGSPKYDEIYDRWLKLRHAEPASGNWWENEKNVVSQYMENHPQLCKVSEDVRDFILENPSLERGQITELLRNPTKYFSIPKNVPLEDRRQVYFPNPDDAVVLMRTSHLGPRYAAFTVPLHFNKLDMRDYLKSVYDVDVLHVRSTITQAKLSTKRTMSKVGNGYYVRAASQKKMTVLLAKPFVYPEEIKDLSPWDNKVYWESILEQEKAYTERATTTKPNEDHRISIKSQARNVVQTVKSSEEWKPTWQDITANKRVMRGAVIASPSAKPFLPSPSSTSTKEDTKKRRKNKLQLPAPPLR